MSRTLALIFVGMAIICVGVTFNAGQSLALQEGGAAAAIVVATIAGVLLYSSDGPAPEREPVGADRSMVAAATGASAIEQAFSEGPFGRERIAVTLDAIERATRHPDLPAETPAQLDRFWSMKPAEFNAYISDRLDRLERET